MKRRSPAILAALVASIVLLLAFNESKKRSGDPDEADLQPPQSATSTPAPAKQSAPDPSSADGALGFSPTSETSSQTKRFQLMPDGSAVPSLPESAPQKVKLGVAIFRYQGAESPPKSERSKADALKLAQEASVLGADDFALAVQKGDRGSDVNVGWMSRGLLEPAVEYAVFTLEQGKTTSTPIDTPRGYWVVNRVR